MPTIAFEPVRVRTGSPDTEGRLAVVNGELVAVLVGLQDEAHETLRGKWFLEDGFGNLRRAEPFNTLEEAESWLTQQLLVSHATAAVA